MIKDTLVVRSCPNLAFEVGFVITDSHDPFCTKYPLGSNAFWEGYGMFSGCGLHFIR